MSNTTPPNPTPPVTPPAPPVTPPASSTSPEDKGKDSVVLAQKLGEAEARLKELNKFKEQVAPILETLGQDKELLAKATEAHNKRLGIKPPTPAGSPSSDVPPVDDTREALVADKYANFEKKVGIDKLPTEKQKEVRGLVGQMFKSMVDPKGNKTMDEALRDVSLTKLEWYLEKAYHLVNRDNDISAARESGKSEVLNDYNGQNGMIGSVPSGSVPIEQVTLSLKEKEVARKMGISEEKYLARKKEMLLTQ